LHEQYAGAVFCSPVKPQPFGQLRNLLGHLLQRSESHQATGIPDSIDNYSGASTGSDDPSQSRYFWYMSDALPTSPFCFLRNRWSSCILAAGKRLCMLDSAVSMDCSNSGETEEGDFK
jgi:hypothetical protein